MPTLQIRLDEETYERVKEHGGSPWARDVLVESLAVAGTATAGLPEEPAAAGEPEAELLHAREDLDFCPRWMHHYAGVKCLTCGETP